MSKTSTGVAMIGLVAVAAAQSSLVSIDQSGTVSGNGVSFLRSNAREVTKLSADGSRIVFQSNASNLTDLADSNKGEDIFVRNVSLGTTSPVSVNVSTTNTCTDVTRGAAATDSSLISADGRYAVFESTCRDLVPNKTITNPSVLDIYERDLRLGTTEVVSVNTSGMSGNSYSFSPAISANGRRVAFVSIATDLFSLPTSGRNVFLRDLDAKTTYLVSVNVAGNSGGNGRSRDASVSADGRYVVFVSEASDLVANDSNNTSDIFVRDLQLGTTTLVSVNMAGKSGNGLSEAPAISNDGRFVVFQSRASDLVARDTNGVTDVFVRDLVARTTTLVSVDLGGTDSGNGFSGGLGARAVRRSSSPDADDEDETDSAQSSGGGGGPAISSDGRYVVFVSRASDLVANDTNGAEDVFVRDMVTGRTALVSVNRDGTKSGNDLSGDPVISADGRVVAFVSFATDLTNNAATRSENVYVRNLITGTTTLLSTGKTTAANGNGPSGNPVISSDGHVVAFESRATDLDSRDLPYPMGNGGAPDVFVVNVP